MNTLLRPLRTSLGKKYAMAITGLLLIGFVLGHMAGNLLIFAGPNALNSYAHSLKANPALLWAARGGLLVVFLLHLYFAITLTLQNKAARPQGYAYEATLHASWASRHMMLTGLVLLAFIVYHLAHFTLGVVTEAEGKNGNLNYLELHEAKSQGEKKYTPQSGKMPQNPSESLDVRHDVYAMVVSGFSNPAISASYCVAMFVLMLHLWHGASSWFQSLGLNGPRFGKFAEAVGPAVAILVFVGNCSIPLAVLLGVVPVV